VTGFTCSRLNGCFFLELTLSSFLLHVFIAPSWLTGAGARYHSLPPPQCGGCGRRGPTIAVVGGQPLLQTQELILSALMGQGIAMPMQLSDGLNLDRAAVLIGRVVALCAVGWGGVEVPHVEESGGGGLPLVACGGDVG